MTNENLQNNYSTFAAKYDQLFDQEMYRAWADFVTSQTQPGDILDLGGGAGRLAVLLAQRGYQVDVLDMSAEMLTLAQQHAAAAGVDVNLLQADMRDWSDWQKTYPTIVSFADALNYLPTLADFQATIREVAAHLEKAVSFYLTSLHRIRLMLVMLTITIITMMMPTISSCGQVIQGKRPTVLIMI